MPQRHDAAALREQGAQALGEALLLPLRRLVGEGSQALEQRGLRLVDRVLQVLAFRARQRAGLLQLVELLMRPHEALEQRLPLPRALELLLASEAQAAGERRPASEQPRDEPVPVDDHGASQDDDHERDDDEPGVVRDQRQMDAQADQ